MTFLMIFIGRIRQAVQKDRPALVPCRKAWGGRIIATAADFPRARWCSRSFWGDLPLNRSGRHSSLNLNHHRFSSRRHVLRLDAIISAARGPATCGTYPPCEARVDLVVFSFIPASLVNSNRSSISDLTEIPVIDFTQQ